MKDIETVLEKSTCRTDSKSRRRSNVSTKVANITAEEIEAGITIEKLEELNVPVFRYQTQLTIHGKLPDLNENRIGGYKCLFENKNKTIGVKYIAVDGAKKYLIERARYYAKKTTMGYSRNSQGTELTKFFEHLSDASDFYKSLPDYVVGTKQIGASLYGGFWVWIELNAIYEADMDQFIKWYTMGEFETVGALESYITEKDQKDEIERQKRQVEFKKNYEEQKAKREAEARLVTEKIISNCTPVSDPLGTVEGKFVLVKDSGLFKKITIALAESTGKMTFQNGFKDIDSYYRNSGLKYKVKGPKFKDELKGVVGVYSLEELKEKGVA